MATVLVRPDVLADFELDLMVNDFRVWLVEAVPTFPDPQRLAFQVRRALINWSQGHWSDAAEWTVVWVSFGDSWRDREDPAEPLPWHAHAALWEKLAFYGRNVRFNRGLGGVRYLTVPQDEMQGGDQGQP